MPLPQPRAYQRPPQVGCRSGRGPPCTHQTLSSIPRTETHKNPPEGSQREPREHSATSNRCPSRSQLCAERQARTGAPRHLGLLPAAWQGSPGPGLPLCVQPLVPPQPPGPSVNGTEAPGQERKLEDRRKVTRPAGPAQGRSRGRCPASLSPSPLLPLGLWLESIAGTTCP